MGRINDKVKYPFDINLSLDDFVIGSDSQTDDTTRNYKLSGVFATFKAALGLASIEYTFSDGVTDPELDESLAGYFTANALSAPAVFSININKLDFGGLDITSLLEVIDDQPSSFVLRVFKSSVTGQIFYFAITSIIDNLDDTYTLTVDNFVGGNSLQDGTTYSFVFDLAGVPSIYTETDPIFVASPAGSILSSDVINWNTAFGWGDHSLAGYLTSVSIGDVAGFIDNSTNWNTAFSWGNHALAGYLTSFTETDPVFTASPSFGITTPDIITWDLAYSWGDHSLAGYLTSETDPIFVASDVFGVTSFDIATWDAAYQWGDHEAVGYFKTNQTVPQTIINGTPTFSVGLNTTAVNFDITYVSTGLEPAGSLFWNETDETLDLVRNGTTLQLGQELYARTRNTSGVAITNGQVVYPSGHTGIYPDIALALANSETTGNVIGVATEDIPNNGFGAVTTYGYVRGLKTDYVGTGVWGTTWVEGDILYLSKTVAGQLTNIEPSVPHHSDRIGVVGVIHPTLGTILVGLDRHYTLEALSDVNGTALTTNGQILVWDNDNQYFDFTSNIDNFVLKSGDTMTGNLIIDGGLDYRQFEVLREVSAVDYQAFMAVAGGTGHYIAGRRNVTAGTIKYLEVGGTDPRYIEDTTGYTLWHSGNDGAGSGLDADLLNGIAFNDILTYKTDLNASEDLNTYLITGLYNQNSNADAGTGTNYPHAVAGMLTVKAAEAFIYQYYHTYQPNNDVWVRSKYLSNWSAWEKQWSSGNDGAGSGLDAGFYNGFARTTDGNRWGVISPVENSGVIEIGRYIDFHNTDADATDNTLRLDNFTNGQLRLSSAESTTILETYNSATNIGRIGANTAGGFVQLTGTGFTETTIRGYGNSEFYGGAIINYSTGFASANPNNPLATVSLNWSGDQARLRIGGSGVGSAGGFSIQKTGDGQLFNVDNVGNTIIGATSGKGGAGSIQANNGYFNAATFWNVSGADNAAQRADGRTDNTDEARLHWYGVNSTGGTECFRHAWYDGGNYMNITYLNDVCEWNTASSNITHKISSLADVTLHLEADTDNVTESHNPKFLMTQDGGIIGMDMGCIGDIGTIMTGSAANDTYFRTLRLTEDFIWGSETTIRMKLDNGNGNLTLLSGTVTATNFILSSDERLKENIKTLERDPLNLRWVEFDRIEDGEHQLGLIAQEVEKTNPEFVITDKNGFKTVKYIDVFVAKMAEKDKQMLEKDKQMLEKDKQIEDLESRMERLELIIKELL